MILVQPASYSHVVTSLDKTLYDGYLCLGLQTSSKFSGQEFEEIHRNIGSLETLKQVCIPLSTKDRCHHNEKCAEHPIVMLFGIR